MGADYLAFNSYLNAQIFMCVTLYTTIHGIQAPREKYPASDFALSFARAAWLC
jgi:hypothetical protein